MSVQAEEGLPFFTRVSPGGRDGPELSRLQRLGLFLDRPLVIWVFQTFCWGLGLALEFAGVGSIYEVGVSTALLLIGSSPTLAHLCCRRNCRGVAKTRPKSRLKGSWPFRLARAINRRSESCLIQVLCWVISVALEIAAVGTLHEIWVSTVLYVLGSLLSYVAVVHGGLRTRAWPDRRVALRRPRRRSSQQLHGEPLAVIVHAQRLSDDDAFSAAVHALISMDVPSIKTEWPASGNTDGLRRRPPASGESQGLPAEEAAIEHARGESDLDRDDSEDPDLLDDDYYFYSSRADIESRMAEDAEDNRRAEEAAVEQQLHIEEQIREDVEREKAWNRLTCEEQEAYMLYNGWEDDDQGFWEATSGSDAGSSCPADSADPPSDR